MTSGLPEAWPSALAGLPSRERYVSLVQGEAAEEDVRAARVVNATQGPRAHVIANAPELEHLALLAEHGRADLSDGKPEIGAAGARLVRQPIEDGTPEHAAAPPRGAVRGRDVLELQRAEPIHQPAVAPSMRRLSARRRTAASERRGARNDSR